jgi:hypothetical protein
MNLVDGQPAIVTTFFARQTPGTRRRYARPFSHQRPEKRSGDGQWSLRPLSTAARATGYAVQETGAEWSKQQKCFEAANVDKKDL